MSELYGDTHRAFQDQHDTRRLADRLESLFRLDADLAAAELGRLVDETRALVFAELHDLELPLQFPPGTRKTPWTI